MTAGEFGLRHARWRAWLRTHTPNVFYRLGLVVPKAHDCGDHDWYHSRDGIESCYHCVVERPSSAAIRTD
jgi:hypothetical protein